MDKLNNYTGSLWTHKAPWELDLASAPPHIHKLRGYTHLFAVQKDPYELDYKMLLLTYTVWVVTFIPSQSP